MDNTSGIFINQISDHQVVFTHNSSIIYKHKENVPKFIEIERSDDHAIEQFTNELYNSKIYEKLDINTNADLNRNYSIFAKEVTDAKSKWLF